MSSVYQLKSRFQALLRPLARNLAAGGISANQVTIAAMMLSAYGGLCMAILPEQHWPWLQLPLLLFVRMALNAVDGMLAREFDMQSRLGAILNELGDVISDSMLYLPFALINGTSGALVVIACLLALISEMTGIMGIQIGASRRYDGPMGKSDRAVIFGTLGLALGLGISGGAWLNYIFAIVITLLAATIFNRAHKALKEAANG